MKAFTTIMLVCCLVLNLGLIACTQQQKTMFTKDVIKISKTLQTTKEKVDYIITHAKAAYNSKDFQQTIDLTRYVLRALDKNSPQAKNLLAKAREALRSAAQSAVKDVKGKIGALGK